MSNYMSEAASDARDTIGYFEDTILEQLLDNGEASDDLLNDYPGGDSYHHESHTDKWFDLTEAAAILEQLRDYEETDNGLWEGLAPREAISAQAAYTYANAVYSEWRDLIEQINDEARTIIEEFDEKIEEAEEAEAADEDIETLQDEKREALEKLIKETINS